MELQGLGQQEWDGVPPPGDIRGRHWLTMSVISGQREDTQCSDEVLLMVSVSTDIVNYLECSITEILTEVDKFLL